MQEAVMATEKTATQKTRSQRTSPVAGVALTIVGLAGLAGSQYQAACRMSDFLGIPLKVALETVPPILLTAWHLLEPCALGHLRFLEDLLQISASCWQFVVALAGAA
jgi:hypothetical protein